MVVGQQLNWRHLALVCALMTGSSGGFVMAEVLSSPQVAVAQPSETAGDRNFLQSLLQLNQEFVATEPQLRILPTELAALDRKTKTFDAKVFQEHSAEVKKLQQQLTALETQFGQFADEPQQLKIKANLEQLQLITQNLLKVSATFETGFNPKTIREVQKFLDFFKRRNLTEANYGFYGSVTQTEVLAYENQQLTDFSETLKQLNQTATQAAIAPDLATSINYLYTTVSLSNLTDSPNGNFKEVVERLDAENASLENEIKNTHTIILFLPLIVMLPTTILVFILFYYFGKIVQEKTGQSTSYQFSLNNIYGLEEELIARLAEKYELKPKLIDRKSDPFTEKLISIATSNYQEEVEPEPTPTTDSDQPREKVDADPNLVMDGVIEEEDEEDAFPVHIPNIYDELVDDYNNDPNKLESEAIALSISHQESYLNDESEFMAMLLLNKDETGEYWATKYKSLEYLIPKANLSVTVDNYSNFKNVFVCYGYQHNTVQKAKLLKPARISPAEEADTWELVQQGIVVLHCI